MESTPPAPVGLQLIESYGGGGFCVAGERYRGSLLVLPEGCHAWKVSTAEEIALAGLAPLWRDPVAPIDLVLFGMGATMVLLAEELREGLRRHGIRAEAMDTGGACRTFNVLLAEERRVAAALLAID